MSVIWGQVCAARGNYEVSILSMIPCYLTKLKFYGTFHKRSKLKFLGLTPGDGLLLSETPVDDSPSEPAPFASGVGSSSASNFCGEVCGFTACGIMKGYAGLHARTLEHMSRFRFTSHHMYEAC